MNDLDQNILSISTHQPELRQLASEFNRLSFSWRFWAPDYIKKQLEETPPKKPFSKAKSISKRLIHSKYPNSENREVKTNFDDLLSIRAKRARRREIGSQVFMLAIVLGIALFLYVLFTNL